MTPLSTYFLTGFFSLTRFSTEARARIRLGDPRLLVVRHFQARRMIEEHWWLCEFLGDLEALGVRFGNADQLYSVQVVCDADYWRGHRPIVDTVRLPWVDSKRTYGVDWEAPLQALSPDVPPRACKNNLP